MPLNRNLYKGKLFDSKRFFADNFDASEKMVLYWPNDYTVIDYYDLVSTANAAAVSNKTGQRYPRIAINWWHPDLTFIDGNRSNEASLPDWYDEEPAY